EEPGPAPPPAARPTLRPPAPPQRYTVTWQEVRPNADLIGGGIAMLGLTYGASIIVGAASDRQSDQFLYVPVAGPWMALANREPCYGPCRPGETFNQVLLVADGLLQGAGVLQILGGFLFPEVRTVTRVAEVPKGVHIAPQVGLHSVGISAYGAF